MGPGPLGTLPDGYWQVPYASARYPGAAPRGDLAGGANCQLWAYEVLAHFGFAVPDFRSDELWTDTVATRHVNEPEALDLVLYNTDHSAFGAHVGLWTGDAVAHLCREVGQPALWSRADFSARPRYAVQVGVKRPVLKSR